MRSQDYGNILRYVKHKENTRLLQSELNEDERSFTRLFFSWLLDVRDGKAGEPDETDDQNTSWINITPRYCIPDNEHGILKLIDFIYYENTLRTPIA